MVKECGIIEVTSFKATVEDQTYEIECGEDGKYPVGSKVRVRLEDTEKPLEIAEIYAYGELGWSSTFCKTPTFCVCNFIIPVHVCNRNSGCNQDKHQNNKS